MHSIGNSRKLRLRGRSTRPIHSARTRESQDFYNVLASVVGVVPHLHSQQVVRVWERNSDSCQCRGARAALPLGIVSSLVAAALWLFVPLALYRLLKGVDQTLAVLMVILGSLMQVPLFFVAAISPLAGD